MITKEEAVAYVTESRDIHAAWVTHLTEDGGCALCLSRAEDPGGAGGVDHHERCIRKYDKVLEYLRASA